MLTVPEVAARLRVAVATVYALVESGKLAAFRIGPHAGAIRVSEQQLETYLETCRSLPHSPSISMEPVNHVVAVIKFTAHRLMPSIPTGMST